MMCYRDMTFCNESRCKHFETCGRGLTREVEKAADEWWGRSGAPIAVYANRPQCYEFKKELKGGKS